jgi:hypothetical protein
LALLSGAVKPITRLFSPKVIAASEQNNFQRWQLVDAAGKGGVFGTV